jgi:hypothetical protein
LVAGVVLVFLVVGSVLLGFYQGALGELLGLR